ncbi:nuclear transport factor 2 family protein [Micromonospora olivasterospora]|uniref:nuclear transport factor 2 family protein n=1 Tax=Micromonospora olivasterospora TaxID=1880 RepID=UPI00319DEAB3
MLEAFVAATRSGELAELVRVLAPDVVLVGDSGGHFPAARRPVTGADKVGKLLLGLFRQAGRYVQPLRARPALVDGSLGLQLETVHPDGRPLRQVIAFTVHGGRITGIFNQLNPEKMARVPALAETDTWPPRW